MKKLALVTSIMFIGLYVGINLLMPDDNEDVYPVRSVAMSSNPQEVPEDTFTDDAVTLADDQAGTEYYIIIASYKSLGQAEQEASRLSDSFDGQFTVLPPTAQGYYRVSCGRYSSIDEAQKIVDEVRATITPNAWILSGAPR